MMSIFDAANMDYIYMPIAITIIVAVLASVVGLAIVIFLTLKKRKNTSDKQGTNDETNDIGK